MKINFLTGIGMFLYIIPVLSQPTTLSPGDIAIIAFNFQNPDGFSFLTFVDLSGGTKIHITDSGWTSENTFRENEGIVHYTVPVGGIKAGTIITYPSDPGFTTEGVSGFFGLSTEGDQLLVYQSDFNNPRFIFGLTNSKTNSWDESAIDNNTSLLPSGLTNGINALSIPFLLNGFFDCNSTLNKEETLGSISNPLNWKGNSSYITLPVPCSYKLPIIITSFRVKEENGLALIKLKATFDKGIIYTIYKSKDGVRFYEIHKIDESQSTGVGEYSYSDYDFKQDCYYRVGILNPDGNESYTDPVFLSKKPSNYFYFDEKSNQIHTNLTNINTIYIFSNSGINVLTHEANMGSLQMLTDKLVNLRQGVYLISYISDSSYGKLKFIKY